MKWAWNILLAATITAWGATALAADEEEETPLSTVPKNVLEAAEKAAPGIVLTEAEVERTRKGLVYELEGTLGGNAVEIEVSADGTVLEVEEKAAAKDDGDVEREDGDKGQDDGDDQDDKDDQED